MIGKLFFEPAFELDTGYRKMLYCKPVEAPEEIHATPNCIDP